jgi:hypothetical protein
VDVGRTWFGMKDVTTATGCAVSRRSARILCESSRALLGLWWWWLARSEEDQRFAVASASAEAERDMSERFGYPR